jgi:hypothetical protein
VFGDEFCVDVPVFDEQMQDAVEQGQIRSRTDRQVQVGILGGGGTARVDDDQLGARLEPVCHPQEQDGVTVGHVGPDHEEQVGAVEVGVGAGWAVGSQRLLVTRSGACHTQPRVRLDVDGAQKAFGEFGGQILRFQRHLTRDVQRHRVRAVLIDDRAQPPSGFGDRVVNVGGHRVGIA